MATAVASSTKLRNAFAYCVRQVRYYSLFSRFGTILAPNCMEFQSPGGSAGQTTMKTICAHCICRQVPVRPPSLYELSTSRQHRQWINLPSELGHCDFLSKSFDRLNLLRIRVHLLQAGDMKESNLAMMRLVWWRDAVDGLYKVATFHPCTAIACLSFSS